MSRPEAARALACLALIAVVVLVACKRKPAPGGDCAKQRDVCLDASTALACVGGAWASMPCRGSRGCFAAVDGTNACDHSVAQEGEICPGSTEDEAGCSMNKRAFLRCRGGKFVVVSTCKGERACSTTSTPSARGETRSVTTTCDNDLADVGDPCDTPDNPACTPDRKSYVECDGAAFRFQSACRGAGGCASDGKTVSCDTSLAEPGDACDEGSGAACNTNGTAMLVCRERTIVLAYGCKGSGGCRVDGARISCDDSAAEPGDVCGREGKGACSGDKRFLLGCKDGRYVKTHLCSTDPCHVEGDQVLCKGQRAPPPDRP